MELIVSRTSLLKVKQKINAATQVVLHSAMTESFIVGEKGKGWVGFVYFALHAGMKVSKSLQMPFIGRKKNASEWLKNTEQFVFIENKTGKLCLGIPCIITLWIDEIQTKSRCSLKTQILCTVGELGPSVPPLGSFALHVPYQAC